MITRTFDAARMNYLVNHESIRPHVGGDPEVEIDLTEAVANKDNYFLIGEHGGFCCSWSAPDTYEIHTLILPEGRGAWARDFAKAGRDFMEGTGATHLWTRVHPQAPHVRRFTLQAGFSPCGSQTVDLGAGPVCYDLFDWRPSCQQQH